MLDLTSFVKLDCISVRVFAGQLELCASHFTSNFILLILIILIVIVVVILVVLIIVHGHLVTIFLRL